MSRLVALVMGNIDYTEGPPLKNPGNDATDVSKKLKSNGFDVVTLIDGTFKEMRKALEKFATDAHDGDVALLYFAGHGVQVDGINYLIATDTPFGSEIDVKHGALSLDEVIDRMEAANVVTNIIVLDACRDNPWERRWRGKPRGLAPVYAPKGTLIAFATSPGQFASDGSGRNGAYTEALLKHIDAPDVPIEAMFKRVRNSLSAATKAKQISWEHTSLAGEFFFNLSVAKRIDEYGASAIKDKTFVLDDGRLSHRTVRALKSRNWYTQNDALDALDVQKIAKTRSDNLFILGRNILQAAHGSAKSAIEWIQNFPERTAKLAPDKRKAILDGMLFEIFFDSDGELREYFKDNRFSDVFALQAYPELQPSFEFIASILAPQMANMFALPGKGLPVSADVRVSPDNEILSVFVNGKDCLTIEDDEFFPRDAAGKPKYRSQHRALFEENLAREMIVPRHLLQIVYNKALKDLPAVKVPYGFRIRRPGEV